VTEAREETGRRRKLYTITDRGREALAAWRDDPVSERAELREPALLKLFFGSDHRRLAEAQIPAHRQKLAEYEGIRDGMPADLPPGPRQALEAGIRYEREMVRFWEDLEK
jgi:DNA-binding MarR family transcriptional regulator